MRLDEPPTLVRLTLDVGLSRLPLRIKRIEVLFEPVLGGFAGIDGATKELSLVSCHGRVSRIFPFILRMPKKSGPFQFVPVIARAMLERLQEVRPFHRKPSSATVTW